MRRAVKFADFFKLDFQNDTLSAAYCSAGFRKSQKVLHISLHPISMTPLGVANPVSKNIPPPITLCAPQGTHTRHKGETRGKQIKTSK